MSNLIGLVAGRSGDSLIFELKKRGYIVAIVCGKEDDPGVNEADYKLIVDLSCKKIIYDFFKSLNITSVIFGTGHNLAINLSNYLENNNILTNIYYDKSNLAKNKIKFKDSLSSMGILTPNYFVYNKNKKLEDIDFKIPKVIKSPIDEFLPIKVDSKQEFMNIISSINNYNELLVEDYILGSDLTVLVSNGDKFKILDIGYFSKAKEWKLKGFNTSDSYKLNDDMEKEIRFITEKVICNLDFKGLVRLDFIVSDRPYILELNSIIVTGYKARTFKYFKNKGINISSIMIDNALYILRNKNIKEF